MNPLRMQLLLIATMAVWGMNISVVKLLTQHYDTLLPAQNLQARSSRALWSAAPLASRLV